MSTPPLCGGLGTAPSGCGSPTSSTRRRPRRPQPERGVALFFAVKRPAGGGALCHYGGHYTTRSFDRLDVDQRVLFKDRDRQARIELRFVRLDEALAEAIGTIPE